MSYVDDLFSRAQLRQVLAFIQCDGTRMSFPADTCQQLLDRVGDRQQALLEQITDPEERHRMEVLLADCISDYCDVYMELGARCGAQLAAQLLAREA